MDTYYPGEDDDRTKKDFSGMDGAKNISRFAGAGVALGVDSAFGRAEREKELIRIKIKRLEAVKSIAEREHALHGGGGGSVGGVDGGPGR